VDISDDDLVREVLHRRESGPFAPGVDMHLQCRLAPHRELILRLAIERFGPSHRAGATAQVELLREEAVQLITQKNRAQIDLEHAERQGASEERIAELSARYEPLAEQVEEIKQLCRFAERNLVRSGLTWRL
jgi:hypothetical protein